MRDLLRFFVSILSYVFWFKGIEKVPASNAAVFTSMVPVSSIVFSAIVLKETVMGIHMVVMGCISGGILISCLHFNEKQDSSKFFKFIGIDGYLLHISMIWNKIP
ncbi:EamA family transporter [Robinsoniella peoriensis]|uniref:EamA family transporter n=1 Tax=Robinsoniella peoriensis TaxID=180332 RepID=UPI003638C343